MPGNPRAPATTLTIVTGFTLLALGIAFAKPTMAASIESNALIQEGIGKNAINAAVNLIRLYGYKCDSVSAIRRFLTGRGFVVRCNGYSYIYEIEDRGGNWVVCYRSCS